MRNGGGIDDARIGENEGGLGGRMEDGGGRGAVW